MKKIISLLFLIAMACSSKDTFQQEFPMPISDSYFSNNGNQTFFKIEFTKPISEDIELLSIYFRNQKATVKAISKNTFEAIFTKPDIILEANSKEEAVNQPPIIKEIPFRLKPNEAALEYKHKGKIKRYLFSNVAEKSNP